MANARASWKGHLKLALLACPIRLFKATGKIEKLTGHYIHKDTKNRIQLIPHDPVLGRVDRTDLVTGYDCGEDRYVVIDNVDLQEIKDPSDKTLSIESFVEHDEVDMIYADQPYYLSPDGSMAVEMLDVLRDAMVGRKRVALARIVLHQRERLAILAPRGRGFLLTTLRSVEEIRPPDVFFDDVPNGDPTTELLNLAEQLIAVRSGRFDPYMFKDRYQAALKALIDQKLAYGETADQHQDAKPPKFAPKPANDDQLQPPTDLAEAFRQSIDHHLKPPAASRYRTGAKARAQARSAAKKKAVSSKRLPAPEQTPS